MAGTAERTGDRGCPLSPSQVLLARFALESMLSSVPSVTGRQIDALRNEVGSSPAEVTAHEKYMEKLWLTRDLTPAELRACRLHLDSSDAGIERYERIVAAHEIEDVEKWQGETMLPGRMGAVPDNPHLRKVVGVRARRPSFQEVGKEMGITTKQAQGLIGSALAKVAAALRQQEKPEHMHTPPKRQPADTIQKPTDPALRRLWHRRNRCATCYGRGVMTVTRNNETKTETCTCQR